MIVVGRNPDVAQITSQHLSISRQHAALCYNGDKRAHYLIDLKSFHGTFIGGNKIEPWIPKRIDSKDELKFGESSRIYIIRESEEGLEKLEEPEAPPPQKKPKVPEKKPERQDESAHCSHLLVKHAGSRRPTSWRQQGNITRTKEDAIQLINHYMVQINSGAAKFEDLAKKYSDCSSAKKGGDLGEFKHGVMQPPFEKAAFGLAPGEMTSQYVETDSGIHIILRHEN